MERCKGGKDTSKRGTGGRETYSSGAGRCKRSGLIAAKVQTLEEQAEERDSLRAVRSKDCKDACMGGTDNGEMLRRRNGVKAERSQAREERAVERLILQRRKGVIAAKCRTRRQGCMHRMNGYWILRGRNGVKAARTRAREERAVGRQI